MVLYDEIPVTYAYIFQILLSMLIPLRFVQILNITTWWLFYERCLITCQNIIKFDRFKYLPIFDGCNFGWVFHHCVKILISIFSLDFYIPRVLRTNYHGVGKLIYFHWMAQRIPISLQVCQVYCIPCVFIISFYSLSYLFTFWHNKFSSGSENGPYSVYKKCRLQ